MTRIAHVQRVLFARYSLENALVSSDGDDILRQVLVAFITKLKPTTRNLRYALRSENADELPLKIHAGKIKSPAPFKPCSQTISGPRKPFSGTTFYRKM